MSLNQSQLIRAFTRTRHMAQNQQQMYKITQIKDHIRQRHQKAKKNHQKMQRKKGKSVKEDENQSQNLIKEITQHYLPINELYKRLDVDPNVGLTDEKADKIIQYYGKNQYVGGREQSKILLFMSQMSDPFSLFMWLLIVLSLVAFGLSDPKDTNPLFLSIIIFITIITGAIISYQFVKDSEEMIKSLQQILPQFANIRRNGVIQTIRAEQIVPGDILIIGPGEKISADVRLIEAHHLYYSKAIFTGESDEILASVECTNQKNALESKNLLFSGYIAEKGNGVGIVFGTGKNTLLSHLSNIIQSCQTKVTNIQIQIGRYVKIMTIFAVTVGIIVLIVGGLIGYDWLIAAMIAIGVTLASAPTVLNLVIVIMLTIAVKRLSKRQIICKNLNVIQSLGSTSCLLIDKTGTITQSIMTVSNLSFDNHIHEAKNLLHHPELRNNTFNDIHKCAVLSSVANFNAAPPPDQISKINSRTDLNTKEKVRLEKQFCDNWKKTFSELPIEELPTIGDSTESALIKYFEHFQQIVKTRSNFPLENEEGKDFFYAFDVLKKYSYCIVREGQNNVMYVKGYPEVIWSLCKKIQIGDEVLDIQEQHRRRFLGHLKNFGKKGERNICFAKKMVERKNAGSIKSLKIVESMKKIDEDKTVSDLIFLGTISISDPIKEGIQETILRIKAAGIKIVMVTGDYSETAVSIARKAQIIQQPKTVNQIIQDYSVPFAEAFKFSQAVVISGDDLLQMQLEDETLAMSQKGRSLERLLSKREVLFYKTNPSQKLSILEALKKMGHVTCAIGDGVNDSPIVKFADAGISMGSGADATKQAADIVFVDNDINHIIFGIEEGRKIFDNLKKSICYVMTSQMSEWLPFVVLLVFQIPIPVFTLLIDGTADFVPAISYAFEDGEIGLMTRRPRNLNEHLVNYKLLAQCSGWMGFSSFLCSLTCYYICMNDFGYQTGSLWFKNNIPILLPNDDDVFNPFSPYYGNSNLPDITSCKQFNQLTTGIDWINSLYPSADLRMSALTCHEASDGTLYYVPNLVYKQCSIQQISIITHKPVCYTTQAAKYGQTAYMYANVVNQIFNLFICKSSRMSLFTQKMDNYIIYMGITIELLLALALNQTLFMVQLIGTRDTIYMHYGLAAIPFGIVQLILDQIRKYLIRSLPPLEKPDPETGKQGIPNWFQRYILW